jgi:hypothetical protein
MKYGPNGTVSLELADIIRVNQLVRNQIDFEGFQEWYDSLSVPEQTALITSLFNFAFQAGTEEEIYEEALNAASLDLENPLVVQAKSFHKPYRFLNLFEMDPWLTQLDKVERFTVFKMCVYLFGTAERKVFQGETKESCNHWWHRDLLDERVVQALLDDPQYWRTSMKDDDLIKNS